MNWRTLIIDGSWVTTRNFMANKDNGFAACVETTTRAVFELERTHKPAEVIVVWDERGVTTIRHLVNQDYKAGRPPIPDDYSVARDVLCNAILPLMGVTQARPAPIDSGGDNGEVHYGEGDDVAASIVGTARGPHLLVAADKDWLQLLSPGEQVGILRETKRGGTIITPETVEQETGFSGEGWFDFLTLRGDTTDKIPGIPMVGKARASELVKACPGIVKLLLNDQADDVLRIIDATDPSSSQWAIQARDHRNLLRDCAKQVRLYQVPIEEFHGQRDLMKAAELLRQQVPSADQLARLMEAEGQREAESFEDDEPL